MASKQDSTSVQGINYYEETDAAYCHGTKQDLIDSGKTLPEWFPGVGKNSKQAVIIGPNELRAVGFDPLIAEVRIERSADDAGCFDVQLSYTTVEVARREVIERAKFEHLAYQVAANRAKGWVNGLPDKADTFKKVGARLVEQQVDIIFGGIARKRGGYTFTKQTIRDFEDAINSACNILRSGEVEYCQFGRDDEVRRLVADAFNRDMCLSLTGHMRDAWIARFLRERELEKVVAEPA